MVELNFSTYPLDQQEITVEIQARGTTLTHQLRRPTFSELQERESQIVYETEEVSRDEDAINADDETANARLWDKIALAVTGYRGAGLSSDAVTPTPVTPELAARIPASHKATAIRALYISACEVEPSEGEGFDLDGETFTVKQTIGEEAYTLRHTLAAPTEAQRREYRQKATRTTFARGSRKVKARVSTSLKVYVELYDALFVSLEGASSSEKSLVDPIFKRQVITALMSNYESSLSD